MDWYVDSFPFLICEGRSDIDKLNNGGGISMKLVVSDIAQRRPSLFWDAPHVEKIILYLSGRLNTVRSSENVT